MKSWDVEIKSLHSKIFHVITEERDLVQEGAQVVEAPVPRDRWEHAHVTHEVELAARAPGATCQRACLQCYADILVPEKEVLSVTELVGTDCDEVDYAFTDLGRDEPLPDPGQVRIGLSRSNADVTDAYNVCESRGSCESAFVSSLDMLNRRAMFGGGYGDSGCAVEKHR